MSDIFARIVTMKDADIIKWLNAIEKPAKPDPELEAPLPTFFANRVTKSINDDILELLFDLKVSFPYETAQHIPEDILLKLHSYLEQLQLTMSEMRTLQIEHEDMLEELYQMNQTISKNRDLEEKIKSSPDYVALIANTEMTENELGKMKDKVSKSTQFIEDFIKSFCVSDHTKKSVIPHL